MVNPAKNDFGQKKSALYIRIAAYKAAATCVIFPSGPFF